MTRVVLLLLLAIASFAAPMAGAQSGQRAFVRVVVYDSLAGRPLIGATVQLVSADDPMGFSRTGESDATGQANFPEVPVGVYTVGFLHPVLDALGVSAPSRELRVVGTRPHDVSLAVPSAVRVRAALCGPQAIRDSTALVVGTVRDPRDGMPLAGLVVTARWVEIAFARRAIQQQTAGAATTTGVNGLFALCGIPSGTVTLSVAQGSDTLPDLELQIEASELHRRDLYMPAPGQGSVGGRIVAADSVRPIAGAQVSIAGRRAVTDSAGAWSVQEAPLGTRMLEVRALGHYPARRPVDVLPQAAAVEVALQTFQAVLDAVHVTATRITGEAAAGGFLARQRGSGMGRFLDSTAIARRNPIYTSDLLRTMPGFLGDGTLAMKGNFSDGMGNFDAHCTAEVYVDGQLLRGISADELDVVVEPMNIVGMEVYSAGSPKPAQFESGLSGCGALVIWQKPMSERVRRRR